MSLKSRRFVFRCFASFVLSNAVAAPANAQATLAGHVIVNFGFHSTGPDAGYWDVDSIDDTLALSIPTVFDLTIKPLAVGPGLHWEDSSIWTMPALDTSGVIVSHSGNGGFNYTINQNSTTLNVLLEGTQLTGPTEGAMTYSRVDLLNVTPAGQPTSTGDSEEDSNQVMSKFNITIPAGANVTQPDGANAPVTENITVQSGGSLTTGGVSTVRGTLTNHGSGNFGGYVHGNFVNDALPASGNIATLGNYLDLYGQLQNTGQLHLSTGGLNLRSATTNAGTINIDNIGQIQVLVSFTNTGTINLGGDFTVLGGAGTFTNNATLQWSAGHIDSATFINNSIVNITGSGNHNAAAAVTNYGSINHSASQQTTFSGGLTNSAGALL